jgi:hypothetical protein
MSRYVLIRRLRGPAYLLLVGVIALLNQADVLSWGHAWPLFLILGGVLLLAERAALATEGYPPYPGQTPGAYPGTYGAAPYPGPANPTPPPAPGSSIVPAAGDEYERRGGQS